MDYEKPNARRFPKWEVTMGLLYGPQNRRVKDALVRRYRMRA